MRRAFLNKVSEMIESETDTTFFTVDIGMWAIRETLEKYPDRCTNVGIYEDGMFSIAAGMASRGLIPTIFGIQPYLISRTLEQIKMDFVYQGFGVNVVGTGAAIDYSKYGYSHYCAEDVMLIKTLPGCEFIAPGSAKQFIQLFEQTYRNGKPTFFRISDHPNVTFDPDVQFGKAVVMKEGRMGTVITVSIMLDMVMKATEGLDVTVLYYSTLEPFDRESLICNSKTNKILIVEPEYEGSLDYDVLKAFHGKSVLIDHVAFPREVFRNYGTYHEKMKNYGMTEERIRTKVNKLVEV